MIKTVLLDMDNTLIHNLDEVFARHYIQLAQRTLAVDLGIPDIARTLKQIMFELSSPRDGTINNYQHILDVLQNASAKSRSHVEANLHHFYDQAYCTLEPLVTPVPFAADLIQTLIAQNFRVVIATNPIYPSVGLRQRFHWGGLGDFESKVAFITDAETMHFAKPDPAYYAEIVARLGVEPDEALMVGDNPINDIRAAYSVGLPTLHVEKTHQGSLQAIVERLSAPAWQTSFTASLLTSEAVLHELRGNIGALQGLVFTAPETTWQRRPLPSEWSILQILTHLADSEPSVQRARLQRILQSNNPFLAEEPDPGPDLPTHITDLYKLMATFVHKRTQTLNLLRSLSSEQWSRKARHGVFGLTTLLEMAHFTAQHDRIHINQLCQTIGRCRDD